MKLFKILFTLILVYTFYGILSVQASSISPGIKEVTLSQGQRTSSSVKFFNDKDYGLEVKATAYSYNPKTEEISEEKRYIFLRVDTDTFRVQPNSNIEISYEIIPIANIDKGTHFNLLVLSPIFDNKDVAISKGISQLVVLHVVDGDVKGISNDLYTAKIEVVSKGVPFIKPLELKYTIQNNSNYVITPQGRIDVFNKRGNYKPVYTYINSDREKLYPNEKIEKNIVLKNWNISDIFSERVAIANISSGLDNTQSTVQTTANAYILEVLFILVLVVLVILLVKSLKEDKKN